MLDKIRVRSGGDSSLLAFLEQHDFEVTQVTDAVVKVTRFEELPVFIHVEGETLYFEVDLGGVEGLDSRDLYFRLLDLNTEILPVSVGVDTANPEDTRLVLVESRESQNLDENEVLSVFDALEIATDKVADVLSEYV